MKENGRFGFKVLVQGQRGEGRDHRPKRKRKRKPCFLLFRVYILLVVVVACCLLFVVLVWSVSAGYVRCREMRARERERHLQPPQYECSRGSRQFIYLGVCCESYRHVRFPSSTHSTECCGWCRSSPGQKKS